MRTKEFGPQLPALSFYDCGSSVLCCQDCYFMTMGEARSWSLVVEVEGSMATKGRQQ
jgi:hypothetical protein